MSIEHHQQFSHQDICHHFSGLGYELSFCSQKRLPANQQVCYKNFSFVFILEPLVWTSGYSWMCCYTLSLAMFWSLSFFPSVPAGYQQALSSESPKQYSPTSSTEHKVRHKVCWVDRTLSRQLAIWERQTNSTSTPRHHQKPLLGISGVGSWSAIFWLQGGCIFGEGKSSPKNQT